MNKPLIKLAYRQVIDSSASDIFEKDIFNDTYAEFIMQIQSWQEGNSYATWKEFVANIPAVREHVTFRVGMAIGLYIRELNQTIPGLTDTLGNPVFFTDYQFELVDSDLRNRAKHKVALTYFTEVFTFLDSIGGNLLLKEGSYDLSQGPVDTVLIQLKPGLSICSYQQTEIL